MEEQTKFISIILFLILFTSFVLLVVIVGENNQTRQKNILCDEYAKAEEIVLSFPDKVIKFENYSIEYNKLKEICSNANIYKK